MVRQRSLNLVIVSAFAMLVLCVPASAVDVNGLVAHWKLDEGSGTIAYDSAGDSDGTIYGAIWANGQVGGALDFDGVDDYVDCGSTFADIVGSDTKTIMAWAKSDTTIYPTEGGRILTLYRESGSSGFVIAVMSNPTTWQGLYRKAGDVSQWIDSGVYVAADEWTHVALVQDGADVDIYINGASENIASDAAAPTTERHVNADIGAYDAETAMKTFFDGSIDEVMIFNRALSAGEVEELYWAGLAPSERAVMAILGALQEKLETLELIDDALEKEWVAYDALAEMLLSGDYGDLTKRDIAAAQRKVESAIMREERSKEVVLESIVLLEDALLSLGVQP